MTPVAASGRLNGSRGRHFPQGRPGSQLLRPEACKAVLALPRLATMGPGCHLSRTRDGLLVAWRVELRVVLFIL